MYDLKSNDRINQRLELTRGDSFSFYVSAITSSGDLYEFVTGTVVKFVITEANRVQNVLLEKTVTVLEDTTEVFFQLTSSDTKIGKLLSVPKVYWYEISINPELDSSVTIIGYDRTGPAEIILYPESGDLL